MTTRDPILGHKIQNKINLLTINKSINESVNNYIISCLFSDSVYVLIHESINYTVVQSTIFRISLLTRMIEIYIYHKIVIASMRYYRCVYRHKIRVEKLPKLYV